MIPVHSLQAKTISLASSVNMTSSESNFMQIPVMRQRISAEHGSRKCTLGFVPLCASFVPWTNLRTFGIDREISLTI
jgi:hypothetical protein